MISICILSISHEREGPNARVLILIKFVKLKDNTDPFILNIVGRVKRKGDFILCTEIVKSFVMKLRI